MRKIFLSSKISLFLVGIGFLSSGHLAFGSGSLGTMEYGAFCSKAGAGANGSDCIDEFMQKYSSVCQGNKVCLDYIKQSFLNVRNSRSNEVSDGTLVAFAPENQSPRYLLRIPNHWAYDSKKQEAKKTLSCDLVIPISYVKYRNLPDYWRMVDSSGYPGGYKTFIGIPVMSIDLEIQRNYGGNKFATADEVLEAVKNSPCNQHSVASIPGGISALVWELRQADGGGNASEPLKFDKLVETAKEYRLK